MAVVALAASVLPNLDVFTDLGVRFLGDTDTHYHVLRAERLLREGWSSLWWDPNLDWPEGAEIFWPPLFDVLIAGIARWVGGAAASRETLERVAAVLPALVGAAAAVTALPFARRLVGPRAAVPAALFVAVLPLQTDIWTLGRPDQHCLECLLAFLMWLAFLAIWREPMRGAVGLLAAAIVLAFWNWQGSAVALLLPALSVAALYVAGLPEARAAARGLAAACGIAAPSLALTAVLFGAPGALRSTGIAGVGELHVALVAACGGSAALLWLGTRYGRPRAPAVRVAEVLVAAALPIASVLALSKGLARGANFGLVALFASDAWYSNIIEFLPLLGSGRAPLGVEMAEAVMDFGLVLPAALLASVAARRRWVQSPQDRAALLTLVSWTVVLGLATCLRARFGYYALLPIATTAALGLADWAETVASSTSGWQFWRRRGAITALGWAAIVGPAWAHIPSGLNHGVPDSFLPALRWLREQPSPPEREGVLADWDIGHAILYYAGKPVLATPFGTTVVSGEHALRDAAGFYFENDPARAEAILARRHVGYLFLSAPRRQLLTLQGFAPKGLPTPFDGERDWLRGPTFEPNAFTRNLVVERLFQQGGAGEDSLGGFALIDDAPVDVTPTFRIFRFVPGARVRMTGLRPGAIARASTMLESSSGRELTWSSSVTAGAAGEAVFRVPYAAGWNGKTFARRLRVTADGRSTLVHVTHADVEQGRTVSALLP